KSPAAALPKLRTALSTFLSFDCVTSPTSLTSAVPCRAYLKLTRDNRFTKRSCGSSTTKSAVLQRNPAAPIRLIPPCSSKPRSISDRRRMDTIPKTEEPPATTERLAYSIEEAAAMLGVHYFSIYRLIQRGKLRACRALRGKLLVPRAELLKLLKTE